MGESPQRPPKVKGLRGEAGRSESLRQKDRGPEGVLESSIGFVSEARIDADGVILSGLGQGG
jgi:hypothetical protein